MELELAIRIEEIATTGNLAKFQEQLSFLFQGLGNIDELEIHLKPGLRSYLLFTPKHVLLPLRLSVQKELNGMEC